MICMSRITLLGALIVGTVLPAQESVGTIRGTVTDPAGKPVAGVALALSGPALLGGRTTVTDAKGEFRLALVLPGTYTLKAAKASFLGSHATFELGAGQTLRQDLRVRPIESQGAEVSVVATVAALDKSDVKTASSITLDTLSTLPTTDGNNVFGALSLAPGVAGSTDYARIRGGLSGGALYSINGITIRDPATGQGSSSAWLQEDLIEDIAIIQSPVNARYGHTSSGIANVVTKTGSNTFTGTLRIRVDRESWDAYRQNNLNRFESPMSGSTTGNPYSLSTPEVVNDDLIRTWDISFLGPIIKDKLTFAYGHRITPKRTDDGFAENLLGSNPLNYDTYLPITGLLGNPLAAYTWGVDPAAPTLSQKYAQDVTDQFDQLKLFWQISESHQLEFGFSRNRYTSSMWSNAVSTSSPGVDARISSAQKATRDLSQVNYRGILGSFGVLEVNYGRREGSIAFPTGPNDPLYVRTWSAQATSMKTTSSANTGLVQAEGADGSGLADVRRADTLKANLQLFLGNHQVDTGVDILNEKQEDSDEVGIHGRAWYAPGRFANGDFLVYNYVGSYAAGTGTTPAAQRTGAAYIPELRVWDTVGEKVASTVRTAAVYVNDLWKVNDFWQFNLGLRMDTNYVKDRVGKKLDNRSWSPRLMAMWDIQGDNRHLLSLTAAEMRGTLNQNVLGNFIYSQGNVTRRYFWNVGSATTPYAVKPADFYNASSYGYYYSYSNTSDYRQISPDLRPERTRELELRYRRALKNGGWMRLSAVYRKTDDLMLANGYDTKINLLDPSGTQPVNLSSALLRVAMPNDLAFRTYKAMELEWNVPAVDRPTWRVVWGGSWTIARLVGRDTYSNAGAFQYYQAMERARVPLDVYNPEGELDGSNRHIMKSHVTLTVGERKGIRNTFSLLAKYESGAPAGTLTKSYYWPTGAFTSGATDIPSTFTAYLNGRGQRKGMDYIAWDFKWTSDIPVKGKIRLFSEFTVRQVFNVQVPSGVNYGTTSSTTTWDPAVPLDSVAFSATNMHTPGTLSGWQGVRAFSAWQFGVKF